MTRQDQAIADLLNALDLIRAETEKANGAASLDYINGVARQAVANCERQMVRNTDGYRIVR